jgi:farnesol dehydrogenase
MSEATQVFVTGATGFIGTHLVRQLVAQGRRVRALTRAGSNWEGLAAPGVEFVYGDIMDADSLRRGMQGCQQVFHLAAYAKNWARDPEIFFRLNRDGTRNVLQAAEAAGVQRVVCTSTIVTFGPTKPGQVGDETMPRNTPRFFTEYEESKAAAEAEMLQWAGRGFPVVVVNPTRVYGPGKLTEGNSVSLMMDLYLRGRMPVLLNGGAEIGNYVLVDDLVQGCLLAMAKGRVGERYILGGENVSLKGFFALVNDATGTRHWQASLPSWAAMGFARFERFKAERFGRYPQITPGWVETFLQDWAFSCAKAERELGYRITPLKEGIRLTCDWLLHKEKP